MSDFSLTLVLRLTTSKIINDVAKVQIKSEKITPFGGIFFVLDIFDRILSSVIDSHLGLRTCTLGQRNVVFLQRYILFSAYTNFGGDFCGCLRQRLMACVGFVACRGWLSLQVREIIGNFLGIFPKSLYLCIVNQIKQRLRDNMFNNLKIEDYETE